MRLPIYQADAFTDKLFGGNPAAICPLQQWLSDDIMQKLAAENNLSETAFFVQEDDHYHIRWFTPATEVKLCGHATLASAHILYTELGYAKDEISFTCLSGRLKVTKKDEDVYTLHFPSNPPTLVEPPENMFESLHITNAEVYKTSFDYMVVLETQQQVEALQPNFSLMATIPARGVIATAVGNYNEADFVSRCFYPQSGINEDPVTGSAHTIMVPYWAEKLGKTEMKAIQLSKRKGYLDCELINDKVLMSGKAVTYLKGEYYL